MAFIGSLVALATRLLPQPLTERLTVARPVQLRR
jgi:hypothetical protein